MSDQQHTLRAEASVGAGQTGETALSAATSRPVASHLKALFRALRPRQWTKNGIVFLAFVFSIENEWQVSDPSTWLDLLGWTVVAFVLFCLVSSADYLINDIVDRESDRQHPEKRRRPIASGDLSVRAAWIWAGLLATIAIGTSFALAGPMSWKFGAIVSGYLAMMIAYTYVLKHIVLMDMMVIGAGFVLRAMAGAVAIDVPISPWLYVVTALGALFLITNKRRAELTLLESSAGNHRPILEEYSQALLDQIAALVTASTLIAYGLYTFTADNLPENNSMMLTLPFVLYGLLRYLYLVDKRNEGGSPEDVLLKDRTLQVCILLWLATSAIVLGVFRD
jgi:4-hydroxybenzoate polyprenyltransferase